MTRNEAKEFDTFSYNGDMDYVKESSVSQRIDVIFDYFENKSCSNCKNAYYQDVTNDLDDDVYSCDEFESSFININDSGRPKDFSCKKWESK